MTHPRVDAQAVADIEMTRKLLEGYRMATAEILYHMPDHPSFLQTFVWQDLDLAPRFPVLHKFLAFWEDNLDGRLHSVRVATTKVMSPGEVRHLEDRFTIH